MSRKKPSIKIYWPQLKNWPTKHPCPGYDLAIKEYKRALVLIPGRKFPQKKIDELTKKLKEMARVQIKIKLLSDDISVSNRN